MRFFVVGEGFLGSALIDALAASGYEVFGSSRDILSSKFYLELTKPIPESLPAADIIFLVAAVPSYRACEGSQESWQINADSPVELARRYCKYNAFPVFVSSDAVEWMSNAYTRQKAYAELGVLMFGGAVIRPRKFGPENIGSLCHLMIRVGLERKPGVYRWQS